MAQAQLRSRHFRIGCKRRAIRGLGTRKISGGQQSISQIALRARLLRLLLDRIAQQRNGIHRSMAAQVQHAQIQFRFVQARLQGQHLFVMRGGCFVLVQRRLCKRQVEAREIILGIGRGKFRKHRLGLLIVLVLQRPHSRRLRIVLSADSD
jgi:hypothetical protein